MSNQPTLPKVDGPITRETLFPEGWEKQLNKPEAAEEVVPEEVQPQEDDSPQLGDESAEDAESLAQAQEGDVQADGDTAEESQQSLDMTVGQFANAAGVTMNDIFSLRMSDGRTLSEMVDETGALKKANDALNRERHELQEKVNQGSVMVPQKGVSPEAQALMTQAQIYQQQLTQADWSQVEPAVAANQKMDLQLAAQQLVMQAQAKQQEYEAEQQKQLRMAYEEADRQTRSRIPEWNDAKVREADFQRIKDNAASYGIRAEEIETIVDPRYRHWLRDLVKAKADVTRIEQGAKKIRKVSKTLGSGARVPQKTGKPSLKDVSQQLKQARADGRTREEVRKLRLGMEFDR